MPTIHCLSSLRPIEARARAQTHFYQALSATGTSASPYGSVPSEVVPFQEGTFKPDLMVSQEPSDWIIKTKKSLSCFYATDLEWLLKAIKCDSLVLAGVSTNADLLSTAFEASCRGLSVFTIPECAASVYGEDLHTLALQQLGRCQGIVVGLDVMLQKINAA
jgi:nicotinamidase-related amidase